MSASIQCVRFLLRQGLAFRGYDDSEESNYQRNFLELLKFLVNANENVKEVVLSNAPENLKLILPEIQKDLVSVCTIEIANAIITDLGDSLFGILIDKSRNVSIK